jgi:hypothetical protein
MSVSETVAQLLETMIGNKQISAMDANALRQQLERDEVQDNQSEAEILQWLAEEYHLPFSDLEDLNSIVSCCRSSLLVCCSSTKCCPCAGSMAGRDGHQRLFENAGARFVAVLTGENITPVLATGESIRRLMKENWGWAPTTSIPGQGNGVVQVLDEGDERTSTWTMRRRTPRLSAL